MPENDYDDEDEEYFEDFKASRKVAKEVVETAKELNKLETGALTASTAGFIALAYLASVYFLVFASMAGALLVYRLLLYYASLKEGQKQARIEDYDYVIKRQKELWQSNLPEEQKRLMSGHLNDMIGIEVPKKKQLARTPQRNNRQLRD